MPSLLSELLAIVCDTQNVMQAVVWEEKLIACLMQSFFAPG